MQDTCSKYNIIKLKKFRKVEFADQDIVIKFVPQLTEILELFDIDIEECFVSDETMYSDFEDLKVDKERLKKFKESYGFIPESNQYLYEIAQKMVCKRKP